MAVKIRLQRHGRKKRPFYHIIVADSRAPRDGRFIEKLGTYNPMTKPATIDIDRDKAFEWLMKGAQPTDTARAILRFKGVYYRKHLMRGVNKGALTLEQAEAKYNEWVEAKEAKIAARFAQTAEEKAAFYSKVSGTPPVIETPAPVVEEEAPAADDAATEEAAVEAPVVEEAVAAEETPATEEAPAEETPATEEATEEAPSEE